MSKLIYLIVLTSLVTMLACSSDDPTKAQQPTGEASPTSTPNPTAFVEEATATPSPPTPTPTLQPPTPVPTPTATPTMVPNQDGGGGSSPVGDGSVYYYAFDPDSTLGDLFDTLSHSEQTCIEAEYSAVELAELRERPVFDEQDTEGRQVAMLECVEPVKLSGVFYSILIRDLSALVGGLSAEQSSCVLQLVDASEVLLIAGGYTEPSPEAQQAAAAFAFGMLACLPELAGSSPEPPLGAQDGVIWTFTTGGWVLTAPVIVDGVVYVGSDDGSLYALVADSGELLWSFATGDVIRSIPTVIDGTVYFGSNDNHLYALDAATGEELWRYDTEGWVQYSPTVGGNMVYFPARAELDWAVHAVDAATGEVVWVSKYPYPIDPRFTPAVHGDRLYAQGAEYGTFYALDAATGEVAWQAEVGGYVESAPTVLEGVVYLTVINQAYAFDEVTGELIWSVDTEEFPARDFPALVVDGVYYLAPSSYVYALDVATGEEIWSYDAAELSSAPVVADGVLYGASELAEYLFALDALTGEVLWTLPTEDFTSHVLSVVDGLLYGQLNEGYLFAVDAEDGSILSWEFESGGFADLPYYTVNDGVVYSAGPGNSVYALVAPGERREE